MTEWLPACPWAAESQRAAGRRKQTRKPDCRRKLTYGLPELRARRGAPLPERTTLRVGAFWRALGAHVCCRVRRRGKIETPRFDSDWIFGVFCCGSGAKESSIDLPAGCLRVHAASATTSRFRCSARRPRATRDVFATGALHRRNGLLHVLCESVLVSASASSAATEGASHLSSQV